MKITIAAIGKFRPSPEKNLYDHYIARLPWKVGLKECEDKKSSTALQRKLREGELLLAAVQATPIKIALDEKGKALSSTAFADLLRKCGEEAGSAAFIIGGADGIDASVLKTCCHVISFGAVTWPHMLVRGLLAEQLYRAHTILKGHPYHRE